MNSRGIMMNKMALQKCTLPQRAIVPSRHIQNHRIATQQRRFLVKAAEQEPTDPEPKKEIAGRVQASLEKLDLNQLQTALNAAIASENYELAAKIKKVLELVVGEDGERVADWPRLGILDWLTERAESLGFRFPTEVQRRAAPVILDEDDCIIESETGSGKTLAFLLPALSLLEYPPITYPDDLKGPQLVIIVPTRELGVQVAMLTYKLFGGSTNAGIPGEKANMFHYTGPRGIKVRGLLLLDELDSAMHDRYLVGAHVVVCTPQLLAQALNRGIPVVQYTKVVAIDEIDACIKDHPEYMETIMKAALIDRPPQQLQQQPVTKKGNRPVVIMAGASLDDKTVGHAVEAGWLEDPIKVAVGSRMRVPKALQHRYILVDSPDDRLAAMCRQLRADLKTNSPDDAPPRVMVFANSQEQARALADPLRTVLWEEHRISVLLPEGAEPIKALHSFRDNQTTLLLATPAAARGLDLPAVTHVYNVSPPEDAADYLHRAGRAGRIGASAPGIVTTMVTREELIKLVELGKELGLDVEQEAMLAPLDISAMASEQPGEGPQEVDVDAVKRALEDLWNLK